MLDFSHHDSEPARAPLLGRIGADSRRRLSPVHPRDETSEVIDYRRLPKDEFLTGEERAWVREMIRASRKTLTRNEHILLSWFSEAMTEDGWRWIQLTHDQILNGFVCKLRPLRNSFEGLCYHMGERSMRDSKAALIERGVLVAYRDGRRGRGRYFIYQIDWIKLLELSLQTAGSAAMEFTPRRRNKPKKAPDRFSENWGEEPVFTGSGPKENKGLGDRKRWQNLPLSAQMVADSDQVYKGNTGEQEYGVSTETPSLRPLPPVAVSASPRDQAQEEPREEAPEESSPRPAGIAAAREALARLEKVQKARPVTPRKAPKISVKPLEQAFIREMGLRIGDFPRDLAHMDVKARRNFVHLVRNSKGHLSDTDTPGARVMGMIRWAVREWDAIGRRVFSNMVTRGTYPFMPDLSFIGAFSSVFAKAYEQAEFMRKTTEQGGLEARVLTLMRQDGLSRKAATEQAKADLQREAEAASSHVSRAPEEAFGPRKVNINAVPEAGSWKERKTLEAVSLAEQSSREERNRQMLEQNPELELLARRARREMGMSYANACRLAAEDPDFLRRKLGPSHP